MAQQSVWQRQLISRHLQESRIHFYHLTEMQFYSREKLTVTSCCYPDLLTVDIHHLAIFLSVKAGYGLLGQTPSCDGKRF